MKQITLAKIGSCIYTDKNSDTLETYQNIALHSTKAEQEVIRFLYENDFSTDDIFQIIQNHAYSFYKNCTDLDTLGYQYCMQNHFFHHIDDILIGYFDFEKFATDLIQQNFFIQSNSTCLLLMKNDMPPNMQKRKDCL